MPRFSAELDRGPAIAVSNLSDSSGGSLQQAIAQSDGTPGPNEIEALRKDLGDHTARSLLRVGGLVIDTFDNSASRRLVQANCRALSLACLHVGLYADYGEIIWDEHCRVPQDVSGDVCDYPLARNLVLLVVAVASGIVVRFALTGVRHDCSVTLRDFAIRPLERSVPCDSSAADASQSSA